MSRRSLLPLSVRLERIGWDVSPTGCHLWRGAKDRDGYGRFKLRGKNVPVTWAAYEVKTGKPKPPGLDMRHMCDTPSCMNADHLIPGTRKQNMQDAICRGRHAHGESHGVARYSDAEIATIRQRVLDGEMRSRVALDVGCSKGHITMLCQGVRRV